jgi:hypothetical protein
VGETIAAFGAAGAAAATPRRNAAAQTRVAAQLTIIIKLLRRVMVAPS